MGESRAEAQSEIGFHFIEVASMQSFPASDAPAWASGRTRRTTVGTGEAGRGTKLGGRLRQTESGRQAGDSLADGTPAGTGRAIRDRREDAAHV